MLGLAKVLTCPFCPRTGAGVVAVDLDAALAVARTKAGGMDVDLTDGDPHGVVVFNPDGRPGRPCPHVVSMLLDVGVCRAVPRSGGGGGVEWPLSYSGSYDHPWFAAHDADEELNVYLWTEVNGGAETAFHPVTPFRIRFPRRTRRVPSSRTRVRVSGTVFLAMEPQTFFDQLRDGYVRSQAFYDAGR